MNGGRKRILQFEWVISVVVTLTIHIFNENEANIRQITQHHK